MKDPTRTPNALPPQLCLRPRPIFTSPDNDLVKSVSTVPTGDASKDSCSTQAILNLQMGNGDEAIPSAMPTTQKQPLASMTQSMRIAWRMRTKNQVGLILLNMVMTTYTHILRIHSMDYSFSSPTHKWCTNTLTLQSNMCWESVHFKPSVHLEFEQYSTYLMYQGLGKLFYRFLNCMNEQTNAPEEQE